MAETPKIDDTQEVITAIVENSRADPNRPRLSPEREAQLDELEGKNAGTYATMEYMTHKFERLAKKIRDTVELEKLDAIPTLIEDGNESLVNHIETAMATIKKAGEELQVLKEELEEVKELKKEGPP